MVVPPFKFTRTPHIYFGAGRFNDLEKIISGIGKTVLIVTGSHSLESSGKLDVLIRTLKNSSINYFHLSIEGEPSPGLIDGAVSEFRKKDIDVILGIGGGSAVDAGKAISAMLPQNNSVFDYLEGVEKEIVHNGEKVPFIAVPTTSGTGSEATKNAVLSQAGADGFKKSIRHDNFVPDIAVIDPELMVSCPPGITAACGMDAFTQLLESYVSLKSSALTDALAFSGMEHLKDNLVPACREGAEDIQVRASMAYASLVSGITLANAGLGIVHGLASTIGGFFNVPHGVICAALVGEATRVNIDNLKNKNKNGVLKKYAKPGALLSEKDSPAPARNGGVDYCCELLIKKIDAWTHTLKLPRLSEYGMQIADVDKIVERTSNKNNPAKLNKDEIKSILCRRI